MVGHFGACPHRSTLSHVSMSEIAFTSADSPPCTAPVRQKDDRCFYFVHDVRHTHVQPDSPDELRAPGSSVATTAGRRRRGVATWGGSPRVSKRDTVLRASRALSMRLGLHAGHVGAASHTPTRNAKPYRTSDGSRPPAALGAPHSDERSDKIRPTHPLRDPGRVQVSDSFTQPCSAYESHTCICKLST